MSIRRTLIRPGLPEIVRSAKRCSISRSRAHRRNQRLRVLCLPPQRQCPPAVVVCLPVRLRFRTRRLHLGTGIRRRLSLKVRW
jgi:hypothetical protein